VTAVSTHLGMPAFPAAAREALQDTQLRNNLAHATATIRTKRLRAVAEVSNWQELREHAALVKDHTLRNLDRYLVQFEETATAAGAVVHWANDAEEANHIVIDLVRATGADEVVKVKSMATQEIDLNEALQDAGIAAWETDLAELIVQLGHDFPSHFLVPAIHRNRSEIREIFVREMGKVGRPAPDDLTDEPKRLAEAARLHLRQKFLRAKVGISGANFAIAETGTLVVVESEGNGRMCLTLPETLISVVGIEKLLPRFADLATFMQLLPRSSTAERMNPYTSTWTGVTPGDGPQSVHIVLLDNGRTRALADEFGRQALRCIRCSACLNVCPVYERVGGHAYGSVYPGPIGAILNPLLHGVSDEHDAALPFASSLCGACYEACPVAIDIPSVLIEQRADVVAAHGRVDPEKVAMSLAAWVLGDPRRLAAAQKASRLGRGFAPKVKRLPGLLGGWTRSRAVPVPPAESFRAWWKRTHEDSPAVPDDSAGRR
jgi:L-lactate dehydrogenase complex protein LldF